MAFMVVFCVANGAGQGLMYSTILYKAWQFFPGKEGVVTGLIIAGFGIGGFLWTHLSTVWVNPDDVPSIQPDD